MTRRNKSTRVTAAIQPAYSSETLATVPGTRVAQQSDCKSSCCRTPFTCAQRYRCACHLGAAQ